MARPPGPGRCVHCLKHRSDRTWDHVFPRAWYPDSTPPNISKWQIPVCRRCNNEYGKLEDDLLIRVGLALDPGDGRSTGIPEKALRALKPEFGKSPKDSRRRQAKRDKILRQAMTGARIPDHGAYPGLDETWGQKPEDTVAIPFPASHVRRLAEKIVRGIFYVEDEKYIEPPYHVHFYALSEDGAQPIKQMLDKFGEIHAREPGVVVCRAVTPEDGISSLFEIDIWGRLKMYAAVDDSED